MLEQLKQYRYSLPHWYKWQADTVISQNSLPTFIQPWMSDTGSLTSSLRSISDGTFAVNVLSEEVRVPFWHEQRKLQRSLTLAALVRQVELTLFGEPVVFARSIIPLELVSNGRSGLANLGRTPLGHLLFKDGRMRVSKREFACIDYTDHKVYARRTPYDYLDSRILVSEFFLKAFDKFLVRE